MRKPKSKAKKPKLTAEEKAILRERRLFTKRTAQMMANQKVRAAKNGDTVPYTLEELRSLIYPYVFPYYSGSIPMTPVPCKYCGNKITAKNFSADHQRPLARGGSWAISNIEIICKACNETKGPLCSDEFKELRNAIAHWAPSVFKNTLARLRAGSRFAQYKPEAKQEKP